MFITHQFKDHPTEGNAFVVVYIIDGRACVWVVPGTMED